MLRAVLFLVAAVLIAGPSWSLPDWERPSLESSAPGFQPSDFAQQWESSSERDLILGATLRFRGDHSGDLNSGRDDLPSDTPKAGPDGDGPDHCETMDGLLCGEHQDGMHGDDGPRLGDGPPAVSTVPEPGAAVLLASGLAALMLLSRRRNA